MNSFKVSELKEDVRFAEDVMLDGAFLLLSRGARLSRELIQALRDWEFTEVYSRGDLSGASSDSKPVFTASNSVVLDSSSTEEGDGILSKSIKSIPTVSIAERGSVDRKFDFSHVVDENNRLELVQKAYDEYWDFIYGVYNYYSTHKKVDLDNISLKVKDLCFLIKGNRRYILQVQSQKGDNPKDFLIDHSLRSTILAITVGFQLHMPIEKMVELGVACILHEIGMIRIPSQLYLSKRNLSPVEKNLLNTHPIVSYTILKGFNAPLSICLAVLEHHEKEDGTGYPRHTLSEKISLYAKIISVVCSFEAITAPRTYKEASSSFEAMVELLKNQTKQYDELVIKALLYSLSLFPIGSYVFLSDGKIGRVIDVNPENPKHPIVQLVRERDENGKLIVVKTSESDQKIVRALNREETADIVKTTGVI